MKSVGRNLVNYVLDSIVSKHCGYQSNSYLKVSSLYFCADVAL